MVFGHVIEITRYNGCAGNCGVERESARGFSLYFCRPQMLDFRADFLPIHLAALLRLERKTKDRSHLLGVPRLKYRNAERI